MTLTMIRLQGLKFIALAATLAAVLAPNPAVAQCSPCIIACNNGWIACLQGCAARYPGGGLLYERCAIRCDRNATSCDSKCVDTTCSGLTGTWIDVEESCKGQRCRLAATFEAVNPTDVATDASAVIRFHLSTDATLDPGDQVVGEVSLGVVQGHQTRQRQVHLSLAPGQSVSGLFLIADVDADDAVPETNEGNNIVPYGPLP